MKNYSEIIGKKVVVTAQAMNKWGPTTAVGILEHVDSSYLVLKDAVLRMSGMAEESKFGTLFLSRRWIYSVGVKE